MQYIADMGGTATSANLAWSMLEPQPGLYNWSYADSQVQNAVNNGLEIFAYTGLTPDWALPESVLQKYGPGIGYRFPPDVNFTSDFISFHQMLAKRYQGIVRHYEFWNEENGCSWIQDGCANGDQAATYVPWLKLWYQAMRSQDNDSVLALGGLDCSGPACYTYLEGVYQAGGGDFFDAVPIHPYGQPLNWDNVKGTYEVLSNYSQQNKLLWINEYGWNTADEVYKSQALTEVLTSLKSDEYSYVYMAQYLIITDLPGTPDSGHDYGLCSRNTSDLSNLQIIPRQSYLTFQAFNKSFN